MIMVGKSICQKMGNNIFRGGIAKTGGTFPPGADHLDIVLDDVQCSGTEQSIAECTHPGWGIDDCAHGEDAGVVCGITEEEQTPGGDTEIPGFGTCGRRPLEEIQDRVKRDDSFELREVEDAPKFERIVGGFTASMGFYPWQVGIRRLVQYPDYFDHHCGGTIISEYWILTAAHCYV